MRLTGREITVVFVLLVGFFVGVARCQTTARPDPKTGAAILANCSCASNLTHYGGYNGYGPDITWVPDHGTFTPQQRAETMAPRAPLDSTYTWAVQHGAYIPPVLTVRGRRR